MNLSQLLTASVARNAALTLSLTLALPLVMAQTKHAKHTTTPSATSAILANGPAGAIVTVNDVLSEMQRAPEANRKAFMAQPDAVEKLVNNLMVRRLLAAEAKRDGLDKDPVMTATLLIARDRALSDASLARLDTKNTPSEAALDEVARSIYKENEAKFIKPAQTRARHILLANTGPESLQKAKDLLTQLRAGASFEELAKANSTDGSAARGGDLGFFGAGQMVQPFEDALKALANPGDLSEPVESQFGWHIIKLEARRDKGPQPYEEVREQLITEGRTAILNDGRIQKVQNLNKGIVFNKEAIEAFTKPATH